MKVKYLIKHEGEKVGSVKDLHINDADQLEELGIVEFVAETEKPAGKVVKKAAPKTRKK